MDHPNKLSIFWSHGEEHDKNKTNMNNFRKRSEGNTEESMLVSVDYRNALAGIDAKDSGARRIHCVRLQSDRRNGSAGEGQWRDRKESCAFEPWKACMQHGLKDSVVARYSDGQGCEERPNVPRVYVDLPDPKDMVACAKYHNTLMVLCLALVERIRSKAEKAPKRKRSEAAVEVMISDPCEAAAEEQPEV